MNDELKKKFIVRNALLWGAAFLTPPIVMVIVDATTRETPNQNQIALFSTMVLMMLFVVSNSNLSSAIQSIPNDSADAGETAQSTE